MTMFPLSQKCINFTGYSMFPCSPPSEVQGASGLWKGLGTPCPGCFQGATSPSEPTSTQPEKHRSPNPDGNCALSRLFPGLSQGTHHPMAQLWHSGESKGAPLCPFWTGDVVHFMGSRGRAFWNCRTRIVGWQNPKISKAGKWMEVIFQHRKAQGTERHSDIWTADWLIQLCGHAFWVHSVPYSY